MSGGGLRGAGTSRAGTNAAACCYLCATTTPWRLLSDDILSTFRGIYAVGREQRFCLLQRLLDANNLLLRCALLHSSQNFSGGSPAKLFWSTLKKPLTLHLAACVSRAHASRRFHATVVAPASLAILSLLASSLLPVCRKLCGSKGLRGEGISAHLHTEVRKHIIFDCCAITVPLQAALF